MSSGLLGLGQPDYYNIRANSTFSSSSNSSGSSRTQRKPNLTAWSQVTTMQELDGYSMRVKSPNLCVDKNETSYSGYLDISDESHFFFWMFEARSKRPDAPLILWLNGGPGCSSLLGLFMELGPCRVNEAGDGTFINKYGWNDDAHVVFLDQPTNVGFSYGKSRSSSFAAGEDVYAFVQLLYKSFPQYKDSKFHVFGESYGGHYVPAIAKAIYDHNTKVSKSSSTNLKTIPLESIGIGNGLVDPLEQYKYYGKMACNSTYPPVLEQSQCDSIDSYYPTCSRLIEACYKYENRFACVPPSYYCNNNMLSSFYQAGLNPYDVRTKCPDGGLCYPIIDSISRFLNDPKVVAEVGSDVSGYDSCSRQVYSDFLLSGDWMKPYMLQIPQLLESNIRVLIYAGDADWICNWYGNKAFTQLLEWSGKDGYNAAGDLPWTASGRSSAAGEHRTFGPLTFLRVFEAGHMVPYDQPENSLDMINRWISNKGF
ncbi:Carboxypeptidase Y-like protein [Smittium mucronatum]|uniref:Carboxypeptidase n=1 Tax=Smittium mucronatum TaxID=133383 RepID=A0A1R0H3V2_9FUNG|nr:Carboxypeptidase Y-like protein [Smittium mucronatum]